MKISLFSLILCTIVFSTSAIAQTTLEEYNYLTRGYKIQLESGLDMKSGYEIKDAGSYAVTYGNGTFSRDVKFMHLYRIGEEIPCATLAIFSRSNTTYEEYYCIPHIDSSSEIWNQAFRDFETLSSAWSVSGTGYSWSLIKMISQLSSR